MPAPALDQAELRRVLDYDPATGAFTWRVRDDVPAQWNTRYAGQRAGYVWTAPGGRLYLSIRLHNWPFLAHRLAWLYQTGAWPDPQVDHIDNDDGLNNLWTNLRQATKAENGWNSPTPRTNSSGLKGASFSKSAGRWRATIRIGGKQRWLGYHDTAEAAHAAYAAAALARGGAFARTS